MSKYQVLFEDDSFDWSDATEVDADDARDAAQEAAEDYWSGSDYPDTFTASVRGVGGETVESFLVIAEQQITFSASPVPTPKYNCELCRDTGRRVFHQCDGSWSRPCVCTPPIPPQAEELRSERDNEQLPEVRSRGSARRASLRLRYAIRLHARPEDFDQGLF